MCLSPPSYAFSNSILKLNELTKKSYYRCIEISTTKKIVCVFLLKVRYLNHQKKEKTYKQISEEIRAMIGKTANVVYIPELAEALRADWYPETRDSEFARNKIARDNIRERILDDWSSNRGNATQWGDISIKNLWFPKWLKDPEYLERAEKANETKQLNKYLTATEKQSKALTSIAKQLPEPPKFEESIEEDSSEGFEVDDSGLFLLTRLTRALK